MTSSASRSSSTIMARRWAARAPAAPARTSRMPRRVAEALGIPHYVLDYEERFASSRDGRVRRQLSRGRDAGAVRRLQSEDQVPRSVADRRGARRRGARHRPLCPERAWADTASSSTGRRDAERDQSYFLFATTREQLELPALPAWRSRQGRDAQARPRVRAADRGEVRQPGHLLRADRPLHAESSSGCARVRRRPATSSMSTAACSAAMAASSITPSASGAGSAWRRPSRFTW